MKSFFQRKNDSQAGVSKSALSKDPYRIWMPRQESDTSQKPLERTEKREGRSSTRESQKPRSSSRAPRPTDTTTTNSATHRSHRHPITTNPITTHKEDAFRNPVNPTPVTPTVNSMQSQRVAQASSINSKPTAPEPFTSSMDATYSPHPSVRTANVAKTYAGSTFNGIYPTASTSASAAIRPEMAKASSSYSKRDGELSDRHGDRTRDRSERERVRERDYDKVKEKERTRDRMERNRGTERERDRAKERDSEREGERVRDRAKERDSEREGERVRDRNRDRDKYRERDREKERDRDKDRTRLRTDPLAYVEPIPFTERGHRERDRQRDTDSVFRASVRDKERTRYRERDIPRNDERSAAYDSGREKLTSKDVDKFRESSRRPDWEQERRTDAGRSSRHRKTEREQDPVKNFPLYQKATGKESSDEAENSDASKNKYSSAYRRTKVKDPIPSALPTSLGQSYLPSSTDPTTYGSFATPSFNQDSTPHSTYPTPSFSKANQDSARYNSALSTSKHNQDPTHYGRPSIPPASKPINDSATSQPLFSPEPLPIRLPTKITESSLFREPPIPLRPPLDGTATASNEAKRSERYNSSTARSRDKVQDSTNNVPLIQQRDAQGQRVRLTTLPTSTNVPPNIEVSASVLNDAQGFGSFGQTSSSYPTKPQVAEPVHHEPHSTRASSSRHEHTSHRHRHIEPSNAGASAPSSSRPLKVSSASQQAVVAVNAAVPSATTLIHPTNPSHSSRRERDKGSRHHGTSSSREPRTQNDANASYNPPPQNVESAPSLLFQGSQTVNPPIRPTSTINNSPHPSIRFTPPTPIQRSPSVLEERPVVNMNHLSTSNAVTPQFRVEGPKAVARSYEQTPPSMQTVQPTEEINQSSTNALTPPSQVDVLKTVTRTYEHIAPSMQIVQPTREHSKDRKKSNESPQLRVAQTVPVHSSRPSPVIAQSHPHPTPPTVDSKTKPPLQDKTPTPLGTPQLSTGAPYNVSPSNTSPSFNIALSSNERGRTISISASNESGSPYKNQSAGLNSVPQLPSNPPPPNSLDTPSSKRSVQATFTPIPQPAPFANSPNHTAWSNAQAHNNPITNRHRDDFGEVSSRPTMNKHPMQNPVAHAPRTAAVTATNPGLGTNNPWSAATQLQTSDDSKDYLPRAEAMNKSTRVGVPKASEPLSSWPAQANGVYPNANTGWNDRSAHASQGPQIDGTGWSLPATAQPNTTNFNYSNGSLFKPGQSDRNAFDSSYPFREVVVPEPANRQNLPSFTNGSIPAPQPQPVIVPPIAGVTVADPVAGSMFYPNPVDPIERPGSSVLFRHPKLAELMSDVASPARGPPEPVIQPLGTEYLPTGQLHSVEKQDDWMLPPLSNGPPPASDAFSKQYPSPLPIKDVHDTEPGLGFSRKNPDSGITSSDPSYPVTSTAFSAKPQSSTMAYALSSKPDPAKESGRINNVTAHMRISSQPESFAVPPRPLSTRPTQTWSSGAPLQSSTYSTNAHASSRSHGRSKLSEPEAFLNPIQAQVATPSPYIPDQAHRRPASNVPSEESILKTPSSLTPSVLKPTVSRTSIPASTNSQQESRKKGLFGIFKSKSSSTQAAENPYEIWNPSAESDDDRGKYVAAIPVTGGKPAEAKASLSKSFFKTKSSLEQTQIATGKPYEIWNPAVTNNKDKAAMVNAEVNTPSDPKSSGISRSKVPPPITVPITIPISERKSPNRRVFTPFRYLTTKRNRTMSAASVEAVDGTAPNTVVGSPTASMNSSQPPIQPPSMRDTQQATHEWRDRKESESRNNRYRVIRPGVVFDVPQDPHQDKQNLRYVKTSRSTRASNAR